jgi:circadian clock protein KaiB
MSLAMKLTKSKTAKARRTDPKPVLHLRLYIAGGTSRSLAAVKNLQKICDEHLPGKYRTEVVDLLKNPHLAAGDQILAVPTLVRTLPPPLRKVIGDLSDTERVLVGLNLIAKAPSP